MKNTEKTVPATMQVVSGSAATEAVATFSAPTTTVLDTARPSAISGLMNPESAPVFCSMPNDGSRASRVAIYNAMNAVTEKLDDHVNEVLNIVDVAAHTIYLDDEQTGESRECVRVILIDADGKGYAAVSEGVVSSLTKIFQLVGRPHWDEPLKMKPMRQAVRSGFKTMILVLVP